jgi:hypothetical protein
MLQAMGRRVPSASPILHFVSCTKSIALHFMSFMRFMVEKAAVV